MQMEFSIREREFREDSLGTFIKITPVLKVVSENCRYLIVRKSANF